MRPKRLFTISLLVLGMLAGLSYEAIPTYAQAGTPADTIPAPTEANTPIPADTATAAPTPTLTNTPRPTSPPVLPTATPTATATQSPPDALLHPLILVSSYYVNVDSVYPGEEFSLILKLVNKGYHNAVSVVTTFTAGDLIPSQTGGSLSIYQIAPGETKSITQPFIASPGLAYGGVANVTVNINYYDQMDGTSLSGSFNLAVRVGTYNPGPAVATRTPTSVVVIRPQLVISGYTSDADPLQPGSQFTLNLQVRNLGNADAKSVTMVLGGGVSTDANPSGTPQAGGITGASGEFTNFAPLGSSNILFLGDIQQGSVTSATQNLIANTTLNPGAYSVKFSFIYADDKGNKYVDDQVITLLIYKTPQIEINFYRQPDPFMVGQPGALPIQIVNLGRTSVVMGNMKAACESCELMNNTTLVGPLDPGGYFPLDATFIPSKSGPMQISVAVTYTDDFNQPQVITRTLDVEVQEGGPMVPEGMPGGTPGAYVPGMDKGGQGGAVIEPLAPETFWQKALRFIKGLIGLDSAPPGSNLPAGIDQSTQEVMPGGNMIIPAPPLKGP
jgi:hypothetical protein